MYNKGPKFWMPIGAGLGVVAGSVTDNSIGLCVALGAGIGLVMGGMMSQDDSEDEDAGDSPPGVEPATEE
jgi:hypothetical protein